MGARNDPTGPHEHIPSPPRTVTIRRDAVEDIITLLDRIGAVGINPGGYEIDSKDFKALADTAVLQQHLDSQERT